MNLSFANPSLFALAAAIGVPVIIHLVARTRPPVYAFPTVDFLRQAMRETMRVRQPREWLVLLLRTLFVAALVGAFWQPVLTTEQGLASSADKKTLILLVDRSASMGAVENGRTRMAVAVEKANDILEAAGSGTLANIIWLQANPETVFPEPGPNLSYLKEIIGQSHVRPETGAGEAGWRLAVAQATAAAGAREIYVISDFQSTAWENWKAEPPSGVRVFHVPVARGVVPNTAITGIRLVPAQPAAGEAAETRCTARNHSPEPMRTTLFLDAGGKRGSRAVDLPPWSETEVVFPTRFPAAGEFVITATIDEDRFPGDDVRHAVAPVRDGLRLGIWPEPAGDVVHAWKDAARALGTIRLMPVAHFPESAAGLDYLLLERWNGEHADALLALAEKGTTVFVQPGPDLPAGAMGRLIGTAGRQPGGRMETGPEAGWAVAITAPEDPVFRLFQTGEFGNPFDGRVTRRAWMEPAEFQNSAARVLAAYPDGVPALARRETQGAPVLLFNLPTTSAEGSWVHQSAFLPFLGELWAQSRAVRSGGSGETLPGSPVVFDPPPEANAASITLVDAAGKPMPLAPRSAGAATSLSSATALPPGHYRWMLDGQALHVSVVNFPPEESDLRVMDPAGLSGAMIDTAAAGGLVYQRDGRPLWPWLLAAAMIFLLSEGLAMQRLPRPISS